MYYLVTWRGGTYTWDIIVEGDTPNISKVVKIFKQDYGDHRDAKDFNIGDSYCADLRYGEEKIIEQDENLDKLIEKYYLELL